MSDSIIFVILGGFALLILIGSMYLTKGRLQEKVPSLFILNRIPIS